MEWNRMASNRKLNKSLWCWNLREEDFDEFVRIIKRDKFTKVIMTYNCLDKYYYRLIKSLPEIEFVHLIGDQCKLTSKEIIDKLEFCHTLHNTKTVHLDLEYPKGADYRQHITTLKEVITHFKDKGYKVELDVETWNILPSYRKVSKLADEWFLMNYAKTWFMTILKGIFYYGKPFNQGIETIPELDKINLKEKDYNKLIDYSKLLNNYQGVAIHHWWSYFNKYRYN